jgi:hypothetical protein
VVPVSDGAPTTITFVASLPPIQSAINLDGNGDGGRVKMDVPASDVGALLLLQHHFSGKAFRVTIEEFVGGKQQHADNRKLHI